MPVLDDKVCPCCAVPEITGATVHWGATPPPGAAATTAVAADATFPEPAEFVAVTIVRNVDPTSAEPADTTTQSTRTDAQLFPSRHTATTRTCR